jgi:hypothetical protein
MAYDPLAPYLPPGSVFTPDHVAHLDRGIQDTEAYVDQRLVDLQAGVVTPEAIDAGIDRAVAEGRIPIGGSPEPITVTETEPGLYQISGGGPGLSIVESEPGVYKVTGP